MVRYRRNFIPGGTWFFTLTLTLADRRRWLNMSKHCGSLFRTAFAIGLIPRFIVSFVKGCCQTIGAAMSM